MNIIEIKFLKTAIDNEIYLESKFKVLIYSSKIKISNCLPRMQARLNAYNLYGNFYLFAEFFVAKFYFLLSFLFFQFGFLKLLFLKSFSVKKIVDCKHLFFINSPVSASLANKFILSSKVEVEECSFFLLNNSLKKYLSEDYKCFCLNEAVSFKSLFYSYLHSIIAFVVFDRQLKLYNFLYFNWLVQLELFKNISYENFHSFDHYCKYAILADSQIYFKNRDSVKYFLHQHGKIDSNDIEFSLPNKLKNISRLVLFDNNYSLIFFKKNVIDKCCHDYDIIVQNNFFVPVKNFNEKRFKVFIIGNLACYQLHKRLIKSLETNSNFIVYYKPHPNNLVYMNNFKNCINIFDVQYFPHADVVVSYDSTLLDEYKNLGYFIINHNLDENNELKLLYNLNKFYNVCKK